MIFNSSVTYVGTRIVLSSSGMTINGHAPELEGGNSKYASELNAYSKLLNDLRPGNYLVTEGSDAFHLGNRDFKVSIGAFNTKQQERAWIAFRERIIPEDLVATQTPSEDLKHVSDQLLTCYQKNVELSKDPAQILTDAERILTVVRDVFIDQVRKAKDRELIIRGSEFQDPLDQMLINITRVFAKILNESQMSGDIVKIKSSLSGLSATVVGQKQTWNFLGDLIVSGKISNAIKDLISFAPTLLNQDGSERFATLLWKHLSKDDRVSLISQLDEINHAIVSDTLRSYWALCAIKEGCLTVAQSYASEIHNSSGNAETLITVANSIWSINNHSEARDVISKIQDASKRDEWYIRKSDELWSTGKFSDAKKLIQKLNDYGKRDKWYLSKTNELWDKGNYLEAKDVIHKLNDYGTRDKWYLARANELWDKKNHSDAKDLIQKLNDYENRDKWYLSKANELWDKGDHSDAEDLIRKLNDYENRDRWYLSRANEKWGKGNFSDAKDLIHKLNDFGNRDKWYLSKANELWDKGNYSDAKDLVQKLNDYENRDRWYKSKADELWITGDKSSAKALIHKLNDYEKRDRWLREKGFNP